MGEPSRPVAWYEKRALETARKATDPAERRKHLHVAWRSRMAVTQSTLSATFNQLGQCCEEGAELLDEPRFEDVARQLAHVADDVERLKQLNATERLFMLEDTSSGLSQFTLRRVETFEEACKRKSPTAPPYAPVGVQLTPNQVIVRIRRTQELAALGNAGQDTDPTQVQVARLALPWALDSGESAAPVESWAGTLLIGERAITAWADTRCATDARAVLFATQVNTLLGAE